MTEFPIQIKCSYIKQFCVKEPIYQPLFLVPMFIAVLGSTNETTSQEYNLPWLLSSPLDSFTETLPTRFLDV